VKELTLVYLKKVSTVKYRSKLNRGRYWGISNWLRHRKTCNLYCVSFFSSLHHKTLEIFQGFAVAGTWLETNLKCWSLQQNAGDFATMKHSFDS